MNRELQVLIDGLSMREEVAVYNFVRLLINDSEEMFTQSEIFETKRKSEYEDDRNDARVMSLGMGEMILKLLEKSS